MLATSSQVPHGSVGEAAVAPSPPPIASVRTSPPRAPKLPGVGDFGVLASAGAAVGGAPAPIATASISFQPGTEGESSWTRTTPTAYAVCGNVTLKMRAGSGDGAAVPDHTVSNRPVPGFITRTALTAPGFKVS